MSMLTNLKKKIKKEGAGFQEFIKKSFNENAVEEEKSDLSNGSGSLPRSASIHSLDSSRQFILMGSRHEESGKKVEMVKPISDGDSGGADLEKGSIDERQECAMLLQRLREISLNELQATVHDYQLEVDKNTKVQVWLEARLKVLKKDLKSLHKLVEKDTEMEAVLGHVTHVMLKLRKLLLSSECELVSYRRELALTRTLQDNTERDLEKAKREASVRHMLLDTIKKERLKELEDLHSELAKVRKMELEKVDVERRLEQTTSDLQKCEAALRKRDQRLTEAEAALRGAGQDYRSVRGLLARTEAERGDLAARVSTLEERLALETDTDERIAQLRDERDKLEFKLTEAKSQLSQAYVSWSDQVTALEDENATLKKQLEEDNQDLTNERTQHQQEIERRQRQLEESELRSANFECQLSSLEALVSERDRELVRERTEHRMELAPLQAAVEALTARTDALGADLHRCQEESQQTISSLHLTLRDASFHLHKAERDLQNTKEQLAERSEELLAVERERFARDLEITAFKSQIVGLEGQIEGWKERVDSSQTELRDAALQIKALDEKNSRLSTDLSECNERTEAVRQACELRVRTVQSCADAATEELAKMRDAYTQLESKLGEADLERESALLQEREGLLAEIADLRREVEERNKTVKQLQQRVQDMKKVLQRELKGQPLISEGMQAGDSACNGHSDRFSLRDNNDCTGFVDGIPPMDCSPIDGLGMPLDPISFQYLRHVVLKFLLVREAQAIHLVKPLSTVLQLSEIEEGLVRDSLSHRRSWFPWKPKVGGGQHSKGLPHIT